MHVYYFNVINYGLDIIFQVKEIYNYTQDDLITEDILLLDCQREIYVWVGLHSAIKSKQEVLHLGLVPILISLIAFTLIVTLMFSHTQLNQYVISLIYGLHLVIPFQYFANIWILTINICYNYFVLLLFFFLHEWISTTTPRTLCQCIQVLHENASILYKESLFIHLIHEEPSLTVVSPLFIIH